MESTEYFKRNRCEKDIFLIAFEKINVLDNILHLHIDDNEIEYI